MYEKLTEKAQKVFRCARQEAQRMGHQYIGTEHLLLGIVREGTGVAATALQCLGIDLGQLRLETQELAGTGTDAASPGLEFTLAPRAKKAFEYAFEEAKRLRHNYIGTEHLLLGLAREEQGVAAQVLSRSGVGPDQVQKAVNDLLKPGGNGTRPGGRQVDTATARPVTADATPEVVALLDFLYGISGKRTLAGQHCAPLVGSTRLPLAYKMVGHYPALFGQDFGFGPSGTWDGINFRQQIVDEAIRRHHEGFVITLMWHAVPPTEDEPVEFHESVQSSLSDAEWAELRTPGSRLHERWKSQVDVVAWFLRQLQEARVPVLWRPYHEMNGSWFWWGGRAGGGGYAALYRMMFERLTGFHGLNNLLWVFNANELKEGVEDYAEFYPGHDVVDVLATDVYSREFAARDYDRLLEVGEGRPIALGEVGALPTVEVLRAQPRWTWFMSWGDMGSRRRDRQAILDLLDCEQVMTHEDLPWVDLDEPRTHYPVLR